MEDEYSSLLYTEEQIAIVCGYIATICFSTLYIPQMQLNYKRKSTEGFSSRSIIIKLIGGGFHFINSFLLNEQIPIVLYGLFGLISYSIILIQIGYYSSNKQLFFIVPVAAIIPLIIGVTHPPSLIITNSIKPASQIFSHIAMLSVVWSMRSCKGISMVSQHINLLGGCLGMYMMYIFPPESNWSYFNYINSILQAISTYVLWFLFRNNNSSSSGSNMKDKLPRFNPSKVDKETHIHNN